MSSLRLLQIPAVKCGPCKRLPHAPAQSSPNTAVSSASPYPAALACAPPPSPSPARRTDRSWQGRERERRGHASLTVRPVRSAAAGTGASGGSVVSVDVEVERISFGGKVRAAPTPSCVLRYYGWFLIFKRRKRRERSGGFVWTALRCRVGTAGVLFHFDLVGCVAQCG
ncbi:hypothetical protein BS78_03G086800 [Paspalum vaginatum]|nr:hypothetical protein BS78_03G086800 [Paspalum vaginatum]